MSDNYPRTMYAETDPAGDERYYSLRLYVAGQSDKSSTARRNLRRFCETHLAGRYDLDVIDIAENPHLAASDRILATPTLLRRRPGPPKRIVGDFANIEWLLVSLDVRRKSGPA